MPVLKVQMPPAPDERRFFAADARSARRTRSATTTGWRPSRTRRCGSCARRTCGCSSSTRSTTSCRARAAQQRRFLNLLRWLGNELQIPLVAVGTAEALRAIQSDDQLANRFTPFGLPPWTVRCGVSAAPQHAGGMLPLRERSGMEEPAFAQKLLSAAEGILGEVVSLVTTAAVAAVAAGEERIRIERIDDIGFIPPTERRRVAG